MKSNGQNQEDLSPTEFTKKTLKDYSTRDSIVFVGGGIESVAATCWAVSVGLKPVLICAISSGMPNEFGIVYFSQALAAHFKLPLEVYEVPIAQKAPMPADFAWSLPQILIGGNPDFHCKYLITGTNCEDSLQQRMGLRYLQRQIDAFRGENFDLHGTPWFTKKRTPLVVLPFEYLTKSEITAQIIRQFPEVIPFAWSCTSPKLNHNQEPVQCRQCEKCIEWLAALNTAKRSARKIQEGRILK